MTKSQAKAFIEGYNYHATTLQTKARRGTWAYIGEDAARRHILRNQLEHNTLVEIKQITMDDLQTVTAQASADNEWFEQQANKGF